MNEISSPPRIITVSVPSVPNGKGRPRNVNKFATAKYATKNAKAKTSVPNRLRLCIVKKLQRNQTIRIMDT